MTWSRHFPSPKNRYRVPATWRGDSAAVFTISLLSANDCSKRRPMLKSRLFNATENPSFQGFYRAQRKKAQTGLRIDFWCRSRLNLNFGLKNRIGIMCVYIYNIPCLCTPINRASCKFYQYWFAFPCFHFVNVSYYKLTSIPSFI